MNKIQKAVAEYERKNGAFQKKVSDALIGTISEKDSPAVIAKKVNKIYRQYGVRQESKRLLLDYLTVSVSIAIGEPITGGRIKSFKLWYLEHAYSAAGVPIKTVLNDAVDILAVKKEITRSMAANASWRKAAQDLSDKKIVISDVAKDVQTIIDKARGVYGLTNESEAYQEYKKAVAVVQRRINRLTDQDTSKLRRAYQDILDITNKSSVAQVDRAVKYASYFKARYNSERIARTEMARAYGDATFTDAIYNDEMIGVQFTLSSGHDASAFDVCDVHCGSDLYGMGAGIYPKTQAPEYPFHPHCLCNISQVMRGETSDPGKYQPKQVQKYLDGLSEQKRRELLGIKGAEAFDRNPKSWDKNLRNWNGQEKKEPTIPKGVLYGGK